VSDKQEIPVTAGNRHVALVGPNGTKCDEQVTLEAGKTTTLECKIAPGAGSASGSAAIATGSDAGSATMPATAAGSNAGSAAAAGSAAPTATSAGSAATVPAPQANANVTTSAPTAATTTKPETPKPDVAKVETPKPDVAKTPKVESPKLKTDVAVVAPKPDVAKTADTSGKGYLTITSKPTAKIAIDGVDTGMSTPISGKTLQLAPGKHKVTFIMGDDRYTFPVTIVGGQSQSMNKDLE
jgi:hypothetical protein